MGKVKKIKTYSEFTEELAKFLLENDDSSIIVDSETSMEVLGILQDILGDYDVSSESCQDEESDNYILSRVDYAHEDNGVIVLEPFINGRVIEMENVMIDMDIFEKEFLNFIDCDNEINLIECSYEEEDEPCICCEDCSGCDEEENSKEEVISVIKNEILEGSCVECNLNTLYNIAYSKGRRDVSLLFKEIAEDILEN